MELEPYPPLGLGKSAQLGIKPAYTDTNFLNSASLAGACDLIRGMGVKVKVNT